MKSFIFLLTFTGVLFCGCAAKYTATIVKAVEPPGSTLGEVSHRYRATGCATVVIVTQQNPDDPLILIPQDTLSPDFDVDGLKIYFNYRTLRMHNPAGCSAGIPAALTDISKK